MNLLPPTAKLVLLLLEHHFLLIGSFSHSFFFSFFGFPNFSWLLPSLPLIVRSKFHPKIFHSSLPSTMTRPVGSITCIRCQPLKSQYIRHVFKFSSSCLKILFHVSKFFSYVIHVFRHHEFKVSEAILFVELGV